MVEFNQMFRNLLVLGVLLITLVAGGFLYNKYGTKNFNLIAPVIPAPTPLVKYSFESLRNRTYEGSEIKLGRVLEEKDTHTAYLFSFTSDGKKITGQANIPKKSGKLPVVVMLRGYADKEIYFTGLGTRKAAGVFAENGYLTLAPDFLGFGGSDNESSDILEVRLEKPTTVLNLLASLSSLPSADVENVALWGHSNGGQIAISVLEITQREIPTILWAPVTRGFPESVTDYLGELDDQGNMVVASLSAFLKIYKPEQFSIKNYYDKIKTDFQIHQGTADALIKADWTNEFVGKMRSQGLEIEYFTYPRNDHNLSRDWDTVIARDLEFLKKNLQ